MTAIQTQYIPQTRLDAPDIDVRLSPKVTRTVLDANWRMREVERPHVPEHLQLPWLTALVPGSVHQDLMRGGVLADPFGRLQERGAEWVNETDWEYETRFPVDSLTDARHDLLFHGLDTVAEITLNGTPIGRTDNMFHAHRLNVDGVLRPGENVLRVLFRSALHAGNARKSAWEQKNGEAMPAQWDRWAARSFVRKAQYQFGWDWGPVLLGAGLWRPVELVTTPVAEIADWNYEYDFRGDDTLVRVSAVVRRHAGDVPLTLHLSLAGENATHTADVRVPGEAGLHTVSLPPVRVRAKRWQPQGLGEPSRYPLTLSVHADAEEPVDDVQARVGFRLSELLHEPDADGKGEGFQFRINGEALFIKGANWIPEDTFPARITRAQVRERLEQARDAGFNMVRVWGGGLYEGEDFYDICDELGLLVWQDFPYACAYYPDTDGDADAARAEAEAGVRRIRHHPSLALWCGNNENQTMYEGPWGGVRPPRFLGENLYFDILPAVVQAEDPHTPYWPSSPFGGTDSNSADFGDCHNWDVWHGRGDWVNYTHNDSRFCSEFGFAASCGMAAWDTVLADADRSPHSPAVRWHDKTRKGYDTYLGLIDIHFPPAQTLEDLVYYSQINQAEALKFGVEHYRRRKGRCWGTLFWQLNDCWPVQSWSVVDSLGEPKAAYYACKKFYAPVLLSLVRQEGTLDVHLVSDLRTDITGEIEVRVLGFDGQTLHRETFPATGAANTSAPVRSVSLAAAAGQEKSACVHARFVADGGETAENVLLLAEPKDLHLAPPAVKMTTERTADGSYAVTLKSDTFAPYVWLHAVDFASLTCSDNFFHLLPGESCTVTVTPLRPSGDDLADSLRVRTLAARDNE